LIRIWLVIGMISLSAATVEAETLEFSFDLDSLPAPILLRPDRPFWNVPQQIERPGKATRTAIPILVLLPPDLAAIPSVAVVLSDCSLATQSGGPPQRVLRELTGGRQVSGLKNPPESEFDRHPLQREGAARLLPLILYLDRIETDGNTWERCSSAHLQVTFSRTGEAVPERGHFLPDRLLRHVINPGQRATWYTPWETDREIHDFVVVARESFIAISTQLGPFLAWKESQGFSPRLVTFEEITAEMAPSDPDEKTLERPEILRGWLQQHYQEEGFKYLLIIGSPNSMSLDAIPMKQCWPAKEWEDPSWGLFDVPTDMYYADLTGNWNPDDDEFWCELEDYMEIPEDSEDSGAEPDGSRLDGVDLVPEILVGRIPHFGKLPNYADGILERTMTYQQGPPERWHNRVLLPSPQVCFPDGSYIDASQVSRYVIENSLTKHAYGHTTLGEWDGNLVSDYEGDDRLDISTMPEYYNEGYGTVFWCAHGNQEVSARNVWWYDANANNLPEQQECEGDDFITVLFGKAASDQYPAVIFQGSCLTANPSWDGNLAHSLLRNVSVANIASTRITLGIGAGEDDWEPSPYSPGGFSLGVYFVHALTAQLKPVAVAFHDAMSTLGFGMQPWTFKLRLEFNVYGDPTTTLPGCDGDDDCDDGEACNGVEACLLGKCHRGQPLFCTPDKPITQCEEFGCDPMEGCLYRQKDNHTDCNDESPCTLEDFCYDGECVPGEKRPCPPSTKICWRGFCDEESGACMFGPQEDGTACDLGTTPGSCINGTCSTDEKPVIDASADTLSQPPDTVIAPDVTTEQAKPQPTGCAAGTTSNTPTWLLLLLIATLTCWRRMSLPTS
jgi:hypothetical protein